MSFLQIYLKFKFGNSKYENGQIEKYKEIEKGDFKWDFMCLTCVAIKCVDFNLFCDDKILQKKTRK